MSWTAMIEKDRQDTVITLYSYDEHEDRALKIAPVAPKAFGVSEEPVPRSICGSGGQVAGEERVYFKRSRDWPLSVRNMYMIW
ncbi:hypothetical protein KIH41_17750 [Litoribacter ruber]|uniref:Uncharacterized protein n=1 Tax=Litoribacter ruber TaxID=702568 RepID=A0AAP2CJH1_9BACT|nr:MULTISPECIES: hypothetical protein [Litoribacter]MBS9525317.1 hypothetical protein [Litoribacter alkaliphilus]MBT0813137.1 hypothetical protein [Litoribacter ruber]